MDKTFISFFSGAGGLDAGFIEAGWKPIFMTDFWEPAIKTLKENHKKVLIQKLNITEIDENHIKNIIKEKQISAVIGGPPCQAFSRLNQNQIFKDGDQNEENLNDPRRSLFMDFLRMCGYIKPYFIIMENVADLQNRKLGGSTERKDDLILKIIEEEFEKIEYSIVYKVINTTEYNVPQKRKRIIFIAVRKDLNISPSIPEPVGLLTSVKKELKKIKPGHPNQQIKNHNEMWVSKVKHIPMGGYYNDLPTELKVLKEIKFTDVASDCGQMREYCFKEKNILNTFTTKKNKDIIQYIFNSEIFTENEFKNIIKDKEIFKIMPRMGTYLRRVDELCSHTITRNPLIHFEENRELSVREKASIQTFPPKYKFCGSIQEQHILVGNAVPCNLGKYIALSLEKKGEGIE